MLSIFNAAYSSCLVFISSSLLLYFSDFLLCLFLLLIKYTIKFAKFIFYFGSFKFFNYKLLCNFSVFVLSLFPKPNLIVKLTLLSFL